MKKLLLTLVSAILCATAAMADATIVVKNIPALNGGAATVTLPENEAINYGDFTFIVSKAEGQTAPAYNKAGDLRLYAGNTLTVKATNNMTKIVFNISTAGLKRLCKVNASTGTIAAQAAGDKTVTWTGDAKEIVFTLPADARSDYGTDVNKAGQLDFDQAEITGGGDLTTTTPPAAPNYKKTTTITSGNGYVLVASNKYNVEFDRAYGYMSTVDAVITDGAFSGDATSAITFTATEGGYTLKTAGGKFLGAKAGYNTFDTSDDSANNRVWTVSFEADGTATITNVATSKIILQDPDPKYLSFGCYDAADATVTEGKVKPEIFALQGSTPEPPAVVTADFALTNQVVSGSEYVFVATIDGVTKVGTAISKSSTYGRLNLEDVTIADNKFSTNVVNAITITAEGNGYTMKDSYGRYLGFDGTHTTSFQLYDAVNELDVWTIAIADGKARISLTAAEKEGVVTVTKGTEGTWYSNMAPSVGATEFELPALYVKGTSGVENIVADENAPVEYFNLQGVRVANPENGLYIRRQGNKVTKVLVK